ncbi:MAG: hypothetical protein ABI603_08730 [Acidobacteriota bacterium]
MRRRVSMSMCAAALAALAVLPACRRKAPEEPPVATPEVIFQHDRVAIGSPARITYKFTVAQNAPELIKGVDYWVFSHVLDPTGEQLWTDDHAPVPPTSTWKPGQTVEYTRTVFVPNYPYIGEAVMRVGLYDRSSGRRLALTGTEASRREYITAKFQLLPQSENIFLIYKDGWHPAEVAPDNAMLEWQWTKKTATISFRNPRKDCLFYLDWDARVDLFTPPQQVSVAVNGQPIGTFPADSRDRKMLTFPITAAQLGATDMAEIVLTVDKTFAPGSGDPRELGIRVFHAFVEPK